MILTDEDRERARYELTQKPLFNQKERIQSQDGVQIDCESGDTRSQSDAFLRFQIQSHPRVYADGIDEELAPRTGSPLHRQTKCEQMSSRATSQDTGYINLVTRNSLRITADLHNE